MKILEYTGLDTSRHKSAYRKVTEAIMRDDFRSAEVKKLTNIGHGKYYRAKLDYTNRLLFTIVRYADAVYALMLEVIENHAYEKSRFLHGAHTDEEKLPPVEAAQAVIDAESVRYVHPKRCEIHLLDKFISFDDAQEIVYRLPPPLIVVGSAGSGKTALTLEKLKHAEGEVLYVTHSAYLAQNARDLYYSHGFEKEGQDATFFSFREFLESIKVPSGREAGWREFVSWFGRMQQQFKGLDPHQVFEEIRGVIAADEVGILSREAYGHLGVRQSIFPVAERDRLYDLFELYRKWLTEARLYDLNLVAHEWLSGAKPRYDFVVVDEVQDITIIQLALILRTLKKPGNFLLCGDSNQIVHPNFFSWSKVKSLFWRDPALAARQDIKVLSANFRNGQETTRVANTLLKIKQKRFGSIDRESNFLVDAVTGDTGAVTVLNDKDSVKKDLNLKTKGSTQFAVLVMRDEEKGEARRFFQTPLIFSIHEAKGLEYDNIIIYRFLSDHRAEFAEIAEGVSVRDLDVEELTYRRAGDKSDKSLEIYKFYVNALYVALTRAVRNVYLIESDTSHALLMLLDLKTDGDKVAVTAKTSTLDDWQKEARKLELQGKQEQADAIRKTILKETPPPWPVFNETHLRETLVRVFREQIPGSKLKKQLYDFAVVYNEPVLAAYLAKEVGFDMALKFQSERSAPAYQNLLQYYGKNYKEILRHCDQHGVDHRTQLNLTPLMGAALAGNLALAETLLGRGANTELIDHFGRTPLHWAMLEAFRRPAYAQGVFAAMYELIAPSSIDVKVGERLVRVDKHLTEYFLFQTLFALCKDRFHKYEWTNVAAFDTATILEAWRNLPAAVLKPARNTRSHLSNVLSRNEVNREYAYNRRLFKRMAQGWYQFNPELSIRRKTSEGESWLPIYEALNLKLVKEFAQPRLWEYLDDMLAMAGLSPPGTPVGAERFIQREENIYFDILSSYQKKPVKPDKSTIWF